MRVRAGRHPGKDKCAERAGLVHSGDPGSISFPPLPGPASSNLSVHRGLQREWGTFPRYLQVCPSHLQGKANVAAMVGLEGAPSSALATQLTSCPAV